VITQVILKHLGPGPGGRSSWFGTESVARRYSETPRWRS